MEDLAESKEYPFKLAALHGKVLIHPLKQSKAEGIIHSPHADKKNPTKGIVLAKGPLCVDESFGPGDCVLFNAYSGTEVAIGSGGEFIVIPEDSIEVKFTGGDVLLIDTETMLRLLDERKAEMMQKYMDDITGTKLVREVFESVKDRVKSLTRAEGFQW